MNDIDELKRFKDELIYTARNSVGKGLTFGKPNGEKLNTRLGYVYRITGHDQIEDIVESGYVRPKGGGSRAARVGHKVYWSLGEEKFYYIDKERSIIEVSLNKVKDGQIGAIHISDLTGIYEYDAEQNKYVNNIDYYLEQYNIKHEDEIVRRHI